MVIYFVIRQYHSIFSNNSLLKNTRFSKVYNHENHFNKTFANNKKLIKHLFHKDISGEYDDEISYRIKLKEIKRNSVLRKIFFDFHDTAIADFKFFIDVFSEIQKEQDRKENSLDSIISEIINEDSKNGV